MRLFRFVTAQRLEQMLSTRSLCLTRLTKWDDPFENVLMKVRLTCINTGQRVHVDGILNDFFGLCWTSNGVESDAQWRIYAPEGDGVRLRTTAGRLWRAVHDPTDPFAALKYSLGRVRYVSQTALTSFLTNPSNVTDLTLDPGGQRIMRWLLLKRLEFKHEREVRLLYRDVKHNVRTRNYKRIRFDPNAVITDITCDPRMSARDFRSLRQRLRGLGFTGQVHLSKLYRLPRRYFSLHC